MTLYLTNFKARASLCFLSTIAALVFAPVSAQLSDEIGRLIEATGEVVIVTNDGNRINAVNILASAEGKGVPIKLGNKIITSEYSSAVIQISSDISHTLQEMTSMQFGTPSRRDDKKLLSRLKRVVSFFMRQSGKEGDYRTELVNTGWQDVSPPDEADGGEE